MSPRRRHLEGVPGREEVTLADGLCITYAPRCLVFIDDMWSGRWQTIAIDPDEEIPALVDALIKARVVANAEDVLDLDGGAAVDRLRAALEAIASPSGKTIQMAEGIARAALDGGERHG